MRSALRHHLRYAIVALAVSAWGQSLSKVTIVYPNGGFNWPIFIAKEGGYYQEYGLEANLVFGAHPAGIAMLVSGEAQVVSYALEQSMIAASKDGSLVLIASPMNRGVFTLMAKGEISSIRGLKGKIIAVGQVGDANYTYSVSLLNRSGLSPRDVLWVSTGPDLSARIAALKSGRVDAALLTAPAYFRLEEAGFRTLANFAELPDIFASTAIVMNKRVVQSNPDLPERIIKAHVAAVKRFYSDRTLAVKAFMQYDKTAQRTDVERMYDLYSKPNAFERVPYVLSAAIHSVVGQQSDPDVAAQLKTYDFRHVIDNSIIDRLADEGFFRIIFGPEIIVEQQRQAGLAFKR
jgi:ABC-type nitrate/sulfonate/bicarbonate transport system substrate-binding protein